MQTLFGRICRALGLGVRGPVLFPARECYEAPMSTPRLVQCIKLHKEAPGLDKPPFPGELGKRLYDQVSAQGFELWLEHQKMLMNEYRIDLSDKSARQLLKQQCEQFFFGDGSKPPPDFVPSKGSHDAGS
jgi:Fe-S cluster biosynthesis and repair protein YggX